MSKIQTGSDIIIEVGKELREKKARSLYVQISILTEKLEGKVVVPGDTWTKIQMLISERLLQLKTKCVVCENDPETCFHCPWRIEWKLFEELRKVISDD